VRAVHQPAAPPLRRRIMNEPATSSTQAILLRVAEARVEDIAHGVARLAPSDLARIGARPGDVLKITGRTTAVARAELSDVEGGAVQSDGPIGSNCGASLDEPIQVTPIEAAQAVAVRLAPLLSGGAAPIIAVERMLEDLVGVPIVAGSALRVPTFAKAVNFQVVRTIPSGPVIIGPRTDIRIVEGEPAAVSAPAEAY